jgi:hypothetical protein
MQGINFSTYANLESKDSHNATHIKLERPILPE